MREKFGVSTGAFVVDDEYDDEQDDQEDDELDDEEDDQEDWTLLCDECGATNAGTAVFCNQCGTPMDDDESD